MRARWLVMLAAAALIGMLVFALARARQARLVSERYRRRARGDGHATLHRYVLGDADAHRVEATSVERVRRIACRACRSGGDCGGVGDRRAQACLRDLCGASRWRDVVRWYTATASDALHKRLYCVDARLEAWQEHNANDDDDDDDDQHNERAALARCASLFLSNSDNSNDNSNDNERDFIMVFSGGRVTLANASGVRRALRRRRRARRSRRGDGYNDNNADGERGGDDEKDTRDDDDRAIDAMTTRSSLVLLLSTMPRLFHHHQDRRRRRHDGERADDQS